MKITLLTHEKELDRHHNTGRLLKDIANLECEIILWQRTQPNQQLLEQFKNQQACLVYPTGIAKQFQPITATEHLVLLDGTWQEARKMYNRSDYLKTAPWFKLENPPASQFHLRRNQIADGLCTCECAAELLKLKGHDQQAALVMQKFHNFLAQTR